MLHHSIKADSVVQYAWVLPRPLVIPMRRSQSTLLMTVLVVLGLFFVSQLPAISNVGTTNPNLTEGARPPATDSDGDKIPDVHENLFSEWINFSSPDNRAVVMKGLDRDNASDAYIDIDIDGLNATEEYLSLIHI